MTGNRFREKEEAERERKTAVAVAAARRKSNWTSGSCSKKGIGESALQLQKARVSNYRYPANKERAETDRPRQTPDLNFSALESVPQLILKRKKCTPRGAKPTT